MQDVQNIPPPDTTPTTSDDDFGSHSAVDIDLDNEEVEKPNESIPLPPDTQPAAPVQEPPNMDKVPVGEDSNAPKQIV